MKAYTASMCVNLCELGENWIEKFETWKHCSLIISCLETVYRAEYSVELPDCRNQEFFRNGTKMAIMPNWHQRLYYVKIKNSSNKRLPPVSIEPGPLMNL